MYAAAAARRLHTHFFSRYFSALTHRACSYVHGALCFSRPLCAVLKWDFSLSRFVLSKLNCAMDMCMCVHRDEKNRRATHAWCEKRRLGTNKFIIFHSPVCKCATCEVDPARLYFKRTLFYVCDPPIIVLCSFRVEASAAFFTHPGETRPSLFACLQGCDCDYFSVRIEAGCEKFSSYLQRRLALLSDMRVRPSLFWSGAFHVACMSDNCDGYYRGAFWSSGITH